MGKWLRLVLLTGLTAVFCGVMVPGVASVSTPRSPLPALQVADQPLEQQGRELYQAGRYAEAIAIFTQLLDQYQRQNTPVPEAMTLSNLALSHGKLGNWDAANGAIARSLERLRSASHTNPSEAQSVLAQTLAIQGYLQLEQGQSELALTTWQEATTLYEQLGDTPGRVQSQINQARAMQALGLYRRAIDTLSPIREALQSQPDSLLKATALRHLGDALQVAGDLTIATQVLQESLTVAQQLQLPDGISSAQLSLGNAARAQGNPLDALDFYQQAIATAVSPTVRLQARLRQMSLRLELNQWTDAQTLWRDVHLSLNTLPTSRTLIYAQVNLANTLIKWSQGEQRLTNRRQPSLPDAARPGTRVRPQSPPVPSVTPGTDTPESGTRVGPLPPPIPAATSAAGTENGTRVGPLPIQIPLIRPGSRSIPSTPYVPAPDPPEIAAILSRAIQQAQTLGDRRAESYALGSLGTLYEQTRQWSDAQEVTERALLLAQLINASDISYRWQWQLGRLYNAQMQAMPEKQESYSKAIAAYTDAVNTLKSIRGDLVAINPEVQFSFQESIEPIHRELVSLLLKPGDTAEPNPANLEQARQIIESLQLAELENFFREACLDAQSVAIDQIDPQAAVIYPIILPDRLEVILSIPNGSLRHYSAPLSADQVEEEVLRFRQILTDRRPNSRFLPLAQQFYNWLIRPAAEELAASNIKTLVFVLDGSLRNISMAALHTGEQYLLEQYNIALTPGLQLLTPRPLQQKQLQVLAAGLTEARQGFSALPGVNAELQEIQKETSTRILLNQEFTSTALQQAIASTPAPIIHLATHGEFSSKLEDTFVLTWSDRITINQLSNLLRNTDLSRPTPVELLVLSACKTAAGDRRAALGLAGMAVRAGARSTIASLWSVDDQATSEMMITFYDQLVTLRVPKAEALRQAQLVVLKNPEYRQHPYFWAAFVLVGNWL